MALPDYITQAAHNLKLDQARQTTINRQTWQPVADSPQEQAYNSKADITGYGGAAGGGKTDLALGLAFTQHERTRIYRKHYKDMQALVDRGNQIMSGRSRYVSGEKKRWEVAPNRVIELRAVQHESDLEKYQGQPSDFICIDEAAQFPEKWMRWLTGWLRTTTTGQRTRVLLTFNPPMSPEGEWIVNFFAPWINPDHPNPAKAGELRWYIRLKDEDVPVSSGEPVEIDGELYRPQSRTFIPARVSDNPFINDDYKNTLNNLAEPMRSQLLFGDFTIKPQDDIWQVIPTTWVLEAQRRSREGERPDMAIRAIGVDPSRGGDDKTSIATLRGTWFDVESYPGSAIPDGPTAARYVIDAMGMDDSPPIGVDVIGIGASVYDHLNFLAIENVEPINVSESSNETDKHRKYGFANLRAQIYWQFREALDPASGENIALPDTRDIRRDLTAARFSIVSGKIKVERKEVTKSRLGRSPDDGESLMLAWYIANGMYVPNFDMVIG